MNPPTLHTAAPSLSPAEAQWLAALQSALSKAMAAKDRRALHEARQAVLRAAWQEPQPPALRQALRRLSWFMMAWRLDPV